MEREKEFLGNGDLEPNNNVVLCCPFMFAKSIIGCGNVLFGIKRDSGHVNVQEGECYGGGGLGWILTGEIWMRDR